MTSSPTKTIQSLWLPFFLKTSQKTPQDTREKLCVAENMVLETADMFEFMLENICPLFVVTAIPDPISTTREYKRRQKSIVCTIVRMV